MGQSQNGKKHPHYRNVQLHSLIKQYNNSLMFNLRQYSVHSSLMIPTTRYKVHLGYDVQMHKCRQIPPYHSLFYGFLMEADNSRTVRWTIPRDLCTVHISYILWRRNPKFHAWMHHGMAECHILFPGHCDLDLRPSLNNNCQTHINYII